MEKINSGDYTFKLGDSEPPGSLNQLMLRIKIDRFMAFEMAEGLMAFLRRTDNCHEEHTINLLGTMTKVEDS